MGKRPRKMSSTTEMCFACPLARGRGSKEYSNSTWETESPAAIQKEMLKGVPWKTYAYLTLAAHFGGLCVCVCVCVCVCECVCVCVCVSVHKSVSTVFLDNCDRFELQT